MHALQASPRIVAMRHQELLYMRQQGEPMHEAIGITLVHQGSRKPFLAQDTNLPWQISLCGSDRRLFYA